MSARRTWTDYEVAAVLNAQLGMSAAHPLRREFAQRRHPLASFVLARTPPAPESQGAEEPRARLQPAGAYAESASPSRHFGREAALRRLRDEAARGERHNLIPCLIDVVQAGVTLGEAVGVMREAYGHAWDPAGQLPSVL